MATVWKQINATIVLCILPLGHVPLLENLKPLLDRLTTCNNLYKIWRHSVLNQIILIAQSIDSTY